MWPREGKGGRKTLHEEPELGLEAHLGAHLGENWVKSVSYRSKNIRKRRSDSVSWHILENSKSKEEASIQGKYRVRSG